MEHNYDERYDLLEEEEDYHVYRQPLSHHYQREFREPQFFQASSGTEKNFLTRCLSLFDSKGAFVAFAIAIAVILYTHYQDYVKAWVAFYFPRDVSIADSFRVLGMQAMQSIYGWTQYIFSGALWEKVVEWTCRRRIVPAQQGCELNRRNSNEAVPELELAPVLPGSVIAADFRSMANKKANKRPHARMNTAPLQPTFLNEADYPAAWVVYHRVLGVVKKIEAEEYEEKVGIFNQKIEAENRNNDEEKKDESQGPGDIKGELDDEKTVHCSNVSNSRDTTNDERDESSSSSDNPSSTYPILQSIAATG